MPNKALEIALSPYGCEGSVTGIADLATCCLKCGLFAFSFLSVGWHCCLGGIPAQCPLNAQSLQWPGFKAIASLLGALVALLPSLKWAQNMNGAPCTLCARKQICF